MDGYPLLSRRRLLRRFSGLLALSAIAAACSRSNEPNPTATAASTRTPVVIVEPTTSPAPSPTPIPDLGMVDTSDSSSIDIIRSEDLNTSGHYDEVRVADDGTRHLIPLEAVEWGGVSRDGIPSIDHPAYVGPDRWSQMVYDPDGLVIGVEVDGKHRAYPLQILIWHEIVNETFDGKHLLVTY